MHEIHKNPTPQRIPPHISTDGVKPHIYSISKKHYTYPNEYLTAKQVNQIFQAGERAYALGCPLNRFITIHYDDYADPKRPQQFMVKILEHSRKWLQRRGLPVAYLYTLENGKYKGIHAHLLIHIPPTYQVAYKKALRRWLPFKMTMPHVNFKTISYPDFGKLHPLNGIYGKLRYMCKGIAPNDPIRDINPKPQGKIYGKRYGISQLVK